MASSPLAKLDNIANGLDKRAEMEISADDPDKRRLLISESDELEDREWLSRNKEDVVTLITKYRKISLLKKCQAETVTNTITIRSGELHDAHVTKAYCDKFDKELKSLGLQTLHVKLEPIKGNKGQQEFGVRLVGSSGIPVYDVASEGEQRCIALAAFLAELSQTSHQSSLVFDDPVSSLDHSRRRSLAARLCLESTQRQVIIFTHDPVFLYELLDSAENQELEPSCRHLMFSGKTPGFSETGLPWDWQKYKSRLDCLEKEHNRIAPTWSPIPTPANIDSMRHAYDHFRATLEKIVQDVVLGGVVARYRSWIKVELLEKVVGFSETEYKEIARLHKKACDITSAHDCAGIRHLSIPSPNELHVDIGDLKKVVEKAHQRGNPTSVTPAGAGPASGAKA